MGTVVKKFSLLFAVIFIITAFSIPVSADRSVVASGTQYGDYDYVLYSDGELKVTVLPKRSEHVYIGTSVKNYLNDIKSVTVDLGDNKHVYYETVYIDGGNCPATKLSIVCSSERKKISNLNIGYFSSLKGENISLPQGVNLGYVDIHHMGGFTDLTFLNGFPKTETVTVTLCSNLKKELVVSCRNIDELNIGVDSTSIDFSASACDTIFVSCRYLTEVYFPDCCKEVDFGSSYKLKAVYIPASVERVHKDCFYACNQLTDIFFYGSKTKFDNIKTYEYNESWERVYTGTIGSITGDRVIHCLNGVTQGWAKDNNDYWYYLEGKSRPVTGWKQINGSWYYFNDTGDMQKEWLRLDDKKYYLGDSGAMKTGWQVVRGNWYYFDNSGVMADGWKSIGGKWYLFDEGIMLSSMWVRDNGSWFYLKSDGSMASNEYINGYWLNKDGSWTYKHKASWKKDSKGWWYGDDTGWYAKNATYRIDGKDYAFDGNGYLK